MRRKWLMAVVLISCLMISLTGCYANGAICYLLSESISSTDEKPVTSEYRKILDERYPHVAESELRMARSTDVFGYEQLNSHQQFIFDIMWQDALQVDDQVSVQTVDLDEHMLSLPEWHQVEELFVRNAPLLQFESYGYRVNSSLAKSVNMMHTLEKYAKMYANPEDAARPEMLRQRLQEIVAGIPANADDYDKLHYLATFLCDYVIYDENYEEKEPTDHGGFTILGEFNPSHTCYGALMLGESVCDGYAESFLLLAREAGYAAIIVHTDTHAWNMVNIAGTWYHVDVTWMDTGTTGMYMDQYFLGSDDDFADHLQSDGDLHYTEIMPAPAAPESWQDGDEIPASI